MYYLLLPNSGQRTQFIEGMKARGIQTVFHYIPLHSSPAGRRYGRAHGDLPVTDSIWERIVRLPLWLDLEQAEIENIIESTISVARVLRG